MTAPANITLLDRPIGSALRSERLPAALLAALLAPLLIAAWQIEPLYSSNQNTKYLHALADAGFGYLREDWLARTKDGLPLFTWLLKAIYRTIGPLGYYAAALGGYFGFLLCAFGIFRHLAGGRTLPTQAIAVFAATIFVLATIEDVQKIAFGGFAKQYVLSGYFQTADFGVLLLLSVLSFMTRKLALSCLLVLGGAAMHPGYTAPGAILIAIYLAYELLHSGRRRKYAAFGICFMSLAALAGMSIALKAHFAPTDAALYREAHRVLTEIRIPEHASPAAWLEINVLLQFALCSAAAFLLPASRFRFVIRVGAMALILLTAGALLPESQTYRLIAPWRLSVILVPLASLAICAVMVLNLHEKGRFDPARAGFHLASAAAIILGCASIGLAFSVHKFSREEPAYSDFVRANLAPGQHYLTPFEHIGFRLATGAPQYVNSKSHPYQDVEVLEWRRRLRMAQSLYQGALMDCDLLKRVARDDRVTHVITENGSARLECPFATQIFSGGGSGVYRLDLKQVPLKWTPVER